jgi:hypothetical protein
VFLPLSTVRQLIAQVVVEVVFAEVAIVLEALGAEALVQPQQTVQTELQILAVAAEVWVALNREGKLVALEAPVLSSSATQVLNEVQVGQLRLVAVTPSTPSPHPAHTSHKEQTWL